MAVNAVPCVFIFTSYSLKGSFVVCCLIDFNENHSIVAKVDFRKLNSVFLLVWVEGGGRGLTRAAGLWGCGGGGHDVSQSPAQIHA